MQTSLTAVVVQLEISDPSFLAYVSYHASLYDLPYTISHFLLCVMILENFMFISIQRLFIPKQWNFVLFSIHCFTICRKISFQMLMVLSHQELSSPLNESVAHDNDIWMCCIHWIIINIYIQKFSKIISHMIIRHLMKKLVAHMNSLRRQFFLILLWTTISILYIYWNGLCWNN